ncbi:nonstructural polyprotein [Soybean thrips dicistrovirus 1]|nr:nonstructural polyprotein [Soybean thrips dicistrovirus 1]
MDYKLIMNHKIVSSFEKRPTSVVLPKKDYLDYCLKISDKVKLVIYDQEKGFLTKRSYFERLSSFERQILPHTYTGYMASRLFESDDEWNDMKCLQDNPISFTLRLGIRKYFLLPHVVIENIFNELRQDMFVNFNNIKTLVPINILWPRLKSLINKKCLELKVHESTYYAESRDFLRGAFSYFEKEYSLASNSVVMYMALVNHFHVPNDAHVHSAHVNAQILLSQLPAFIAFAYKYTYLDKLDYTFRYIGEVYSSLLLCCLVHTNPVEITESDFVCDFTEHMINLSMYRPNHLIIKNNGCIEDSVVKFDSYAQFNLEHKISVDSEFTSVLEKIVKSFDLALKKFDKVKNNTLIEFRKKVAAFITICYNIYRLTVRELKFQDCLINLIGILLSTSLADSLVSSINNLVNNSLGQSGDNFDFTTIYKMIGLAAFVLFANIVPDTKAMTNLITKLDRIPKSIDGLTKIWKHFDNIMDNIWPWIQVNVLRQEGRYIPKVLSDDVLAWTAEVTELLEFSKRKSIRSDADVMKRCSSLYQRGMRLIRECTTQKLDKKNVEMISKLLPAAKILMEDAFKSGADKMCLRQEPLMVWFTGPSGVGKTGLTYPFLIDMMRVNGTVKTNYTQNIYARQAETEYWDAYIDQEYIIVDDAFQAKDSIARPNPELFEIIRMGNMFPDHLHMAAVEEKNNTFFNGKCVILSSNLEKIQCESLNCDVAISRRINLAFRVGTKEEYRRYYVDDCGRPCYMLDNIKAKSTCGKPINLDAYEFEQFDPVSNQVIKTGLSYSDVIAMGQEYYHNNIMTHRNMSEFLADYIKDTDTEYEKANKRAFEILSYDVSEAHVDTDAIKFVNKNVKDSFSRLGYRFHFIKRYVQDLIYDRNIISVNKVSTCITKEKFLDKMSRIATDVTMHFREEKYQREQALIDRFTPYWDIFVYSFGVVAACFVSYTAGKIIKASKNILFTPTYIKEEKKIYNKINLANSCINNGCENCKKCKHTYNTEKQIKWYTSCECYAESMEDISEHLDIFAISAYNQKPRMLKQIIDLNPDIIIVILEQMFNCNCKNCKVCQDEGLLDHFSNACTVYQCPCVCVVARLSQGFALVEVLSLLKYCGDLNRGLIKNEYLRNMYRKMSSDVEFFESTDEYIELTKQIKYEAVPQKLNKVIKYQNENLKINKQIKYDQNLTPQKINIRYQNVTPVEQRKAPNEDLNADTIMNHVVYPNLVVMRGKRTESGNWSTLGCVLFIKGRVALMPYHYIVAIRDLGYESIQLYNYSKVMCETPVSALNYERFDGIEKDAVLVEFPVIMNDFKDISKHFVDIKDYDRVKGCPAILARYTFDNESVMKAPIYLESIGVAERERCNEVIVKGSETIVLSREYYSYNACTRGGDCGSTLVVMNASVQGKILGIHNSGTPSLNHGNAVAINRKMLSDCLRKFKSIGQYAYESSLLTAPLDALSDSGNFVLHRTVDVKLPTSSNTALAHSCLYGAFIESPNAPAKLRPFKNKEGVLIDPFVLQRKKYGVPRPYLDQNLIDSIVEGIKGQYYISNKNTPGIYKMPLTIEQSVKGIDGDPFINSINRMTSPGYPYSLERKGKPGKTMWFGDKDEYDLDNDNFKNLVNNINKMQNNILDNIRPEVIWVDTLKDARIPKEKAELGKTRLFSAAPLDYVIALRQIAVPFIAHVSNNRIDNSIAVGINPCSPEWSILANRLQTKGDAVIAGDYSNFDGTLPAQIVFGAINIMVDWYKLHWDFVKEQGRNIICDRELTWLEFRDYCIKLYYECVHHTHITNYENGALMYYVRNGIPSGCPVTAILNSIVNRLGLCYVWHKIFENTDLANVRSFIDNTTDIYYGDDFIMNISKRVVHSFNQISITKNLKQHLDMDMTDELKSKDGVAPFRNLSEVSFLKRKFFFCDTIMEYTAPLELNVILDSINWVRIGNELPLLTTISILESALRELALHPSWVDDDYREQIEEYGYKLASQVHGYSFVCESRLNTLYNVKNSLWSNLLEL